MVNCDVYGKFHNSCCTLVAKTSVSSSDVEDTSTPSVFAPRAYHPAISLTSLSVILESFVPPHHRRQPLLNATVFEAVPPSSFTTLMITEAVSGMLRNQKSMPV